MRREEQRIAKDLLKVAKAILSFEESAEFKNVLLTPRSIIQFQLHWPMEQTEVICKKGIVNVNG